MFNDNFLLLQILEAEAFLDWRDLHLTGNGKQSLNLITKIEQTKNRKYLYDDSST